MKKKKKERTIYFIAIPNFSLIFFKFKYEAKHYIDEMIKPYWEENIEIYSAKCSIDSDDDSIDYLIAKLNDREITMEMEYYG